MLGGAKLLVTVMLDTVVCGKIGLDLDPFLWSLI